MNVTATTADGASLSTTVNLTISDQAVEYTVAGRIDLTATHFPSAIKR
jgi:hypothetical protein